MTQYEHNLAEHLSERPLVRTVDQLKSTTTNMRGFADSVDHLLNALEEFYPFIDKLMSSTEQLRNTIRKTPPPMYHRPPGYRYNRMHQRTERSDSRNRSVSCKMETLRIKEIRFSSGRRSLYRHECYPS